MPFTPDIRKAVALVKERRLPWRLSRWLDQRKLEHARARADRQARSTRPFVTGQEVPHFEVHVLLGHKHVGMTLWCIKSLLHHAGHSYKVVLHEDGSLTEEDIALLQEHLLNVTIIRKAVADDLIRKHLEHKPNCLRYRFSKKEATDHRGAKYDEHIFALRLFDFNLLSSATKILVLDCDILFFQPPREIMEWAQDAGRRGSLYSLEQYVPLRNARYQITGYRYKDPLPTDGNAGLLCLDKRIFDIDAVEAWIGKNLDQARKLATFEQHAYNHLLRLAANGSALPDRYSFNYTDQTAVASHFAIKHLFFENLPRLKSALTGPARTAPAGKPS
jgi:hypothetical protein